MELPKVSIITPTYNKKSFIPLAVHNFLSFDYPQDKWVQRVSSDYNMVAISDAKPLGTASAYITEEEGVKVAHIVGVYVAKEARGKGIGSQLVTTVLGKIKADDEIKKVELSVNLDQTPAKRLYEKFGFKVVGEDTLKMGDGKEHTECKMELVL